MHVIRGLDSSHRHKFTFANFGLVSLSSTQQKCDAETAI